MTAAAATACPFCSAQGTTLSGEVAEADFIVLGRMVNPRRDPADVTKGETDLVIDSVVKPHPYLAGKTQVDAPAVRARRPRGEGRQVHRLLQALHARDHHRGRGRRLGGAARRPADHGPRRLPRRAGRGQEQAGRVPPGGHRRPREADDRPAEVLLRLPRRPRPGHQHRRHERVRRGRLPRGAGDGQEPAGREGARLDQGPEHPAEPPRPVRPVHRPLRQAGRRRRPAGAARRHREPVHRRPRRRAGRVHAPRPEGGRGVPRPAHRRPEERLPGAVRRLQGLRLPLGLPPGHRQARRHPRRHAEADGDPRHGRPADGATPQVGPLGADRQGAGVHEGEVAQRRADRPPGDPEVRHRRPRRPRPRRRPTSRRPARTTPTASSTSSRRCTTS